MVHSSFHKWVLINIGHCYEYSIYAVVNLALPTWRAKLFPFLEWLLKQVDLVGVLWRLCTWLNIRTLAIWAAQRKQCHSLQERRKRGGNQVVAYQVSNAGAAAVWPAVLRLDRWPLSCRCHCPICGEHMLIGTISFSKILHFCKAPRDILISCHSDKLSLFFGEQIH